MSMQKVSDKMLADTGTMPAWDGSALTSLSAGNMVAGGAFPAIDGSALTGIAAGGVDANGFYVYLTSAQANCTGDNTTVNLSSAGHTTVIDTGSDVSNGTHTAPATGLYCYTVAVNFGGISSSHNLIAIDLITSNRTRWGLENHAYNTANSGSQGTWISTWITDMDASDTAYYTIRVKGGAKTCDLQATTTIFTGFRIE